MKSYCKVFGALSRRKGITMGTARNEKIKKVSPARRKKIEARAAELIVEEMSLQELREAHRLTQQRIAEALGIGQDGVSRLEKRSDLLISTLRSYIEGVDRQLRSLGAEVWRAARQFALEGVCDYAQEWCAAGNQNKSTAIT
jgi:hypothetical protein